MSAREQAVADEVTLAAKNGDWARVQWLVDQLLAERRAARGSSSRVT